MRSKWAALVVAVILVLLLPGGVTLATPTPPYLLVNHAAKQCAVRILGDDCNWCDPPEGWEVLGMSGAVECPAGYVQVEQIDMICRRYKNPFCCTSTSHHGDCEDMVISRPQQLCAFVADIAGCLLPEGWTGRPADVPEYSWTCPYDYQWTDDVACLDEAAASTPAATPAPTATETPVRPTPSRTRPMSTPSPAATQMPTAGPAATLTPAAAFFYALLVAAGVLLVLLIWFVARRSARRRR